MRRMNYRHPYREHDPARIIVPQDNAAVLLDDHEEKLRRQAKKARKKTKKQKAAAAEAAARADARGWKSAGGGVMKRTVKLPRNSR